MLNTNITEDSLLINKIIMTNNTAYDLSMNSLGSILTFLGTGLIKVITGSLPTSFEVIHTGFLAIETLTIGFFGTWLYRWSSRKIMTKFKKNEPESRTI